MATAGDRWCVPTGPQHGHDVLHAVRRLILGDLQLGGDLPVGPALGHEGEDVGLGGRQAEPAVAGVGVGRA